MLIESIAKMEGKVMASGRSTSNIDLARDGHLPDAVSCLHEQRLPGAAGRVADLRLPVPRSKGSQRHLCVCAMQRSEISIKLLRKKDKAMGK